MQDQDHGQFEKAGISAKTFGEKQTNKQKTTKDHMRGFRDK